MATNFPGSLDSFTNPSSSSTLDSPSHAAQHANINDAMVAVQTKLGIGAGTIGTWTTWTPVVSQGVILTTSILYAKYTQINKTVHAIGRLTIQSAGTAGSGIGWTVPVAAAQTQSVDGVFYYFDQNVATAYVGTSYKLNATNSVGISYNSGGGYLGTTPAVTAASGDSILFHLTYEAA